MPGRVGQTRGCWGQPSLLVPWTAASHRVYCLVGFKLLKKPAASPPQTHFTRPISLSTLTPSIHKCATHMDTGIPPPGPNPVSLPRKAGSWGENGAPHQVLQVPLLPYTTCMAASLYLLPGCPSSPCTLPAPSMARVLIPAAHIPQQV